MLITSLQINTLNSGDVKKFSGFEPVIFKHAQTLELVKAEHKHIQYIPATKKKKKRKKQPKQTKDY